MAPDSDVKDRIIHPGQNDVLEAEYSLISSDDILNEDDDEEDDEGDEEGRASFGLDTPEPAIPAATGPEMPMAKGKAKPKKGNKAKTGAKSVLGGKFAVAAEEAAGAPSTVMALDIDAKAFGFAETAEAPKVEGEQQPGYETAFDRDEVTDPEDDDIGLLNMLFGAGHDKPWDEKLSAAERAAMMKVFHTHNPMEAEKALDETDPDLLERKGKSRTATRIATVGTIAAAAALAAKAAEARQKTLAEKGQIAGGLKTVPKHLLNINTGQDDHKKDITEAAQTAPKTLVYSREYGEDVKMEKVDRTLNAALGIGSMVGLPSSLALLNTRLTTGENPVQNDYFGLAQTIALQNQMQMQADISWTPQSQSRDMVFTQAMNEIYSALSTETLINVSPYRETMWAEKRLEQKENSADITLSNPALAVQAPAPEPTYNQEYKMNIGAPGM